MKKILLWLCLVALLLFASGFAFASPATQPVPEQATMLFFGACLFGIAGLVRKKLLGRL